MSRLIPFHLFRGKGFAPAGDTIVGVAPRDCVVAAYGGGGMKGAGGLEAAFGGAAYFRNEESGDEYLGVWGARNASRFRSALRQSGVVLEIIREPPPARLMWFGTRDARPKKRTSD